LSFTMLTAYLVAASALWLTLRRTKKPA